MHILKTNKKKKCIYQHLSVKQFIQSKIWSKEKGERNTQKLHLNWSKIHLPSLDAVHLLQEPLKRIFATILNCIVTLFATFTMSRILIPLNFRAQVVLRRYHVASCWLVQRICTLHELYTLESKYPPTEKLIKGYPPTENLIKGYLLDTLGCSMVVKGQAWYEP